jgi:hypothetical protein
VILIIVLVVFIRRHKNDPEYTTPLINGGQTGARGGNGDGL